MIPDKIINDKLSLKIFDLFGHQIIERKIYNEKNIQLDFTKYSKGMYCVLLNDSKEIYRSKFILN